MPILKTHSSPFPLPVRAAIEIGRLYQFKLSALDDKVSEVYKSNLNANPELKSSQIEWIKESRKCESAPSPVDCLKASYIERLALLTGTASAGTSQSNASSIAEAEKPIQPAPTVTQSKAKSVNAESTKSFGALGAVGALLLLVGAAFLLWKKRQKSEPASPVPSPVKAPVDKIATQTQPKQISEITQPIPRQANTPDNGVVSTGELNMGSAEGLTDVVDGVPASNHGSIADWKRVDKNSAEYKFTTLISVVNDDTWFPDDSPGYFIFPDGVTISTEQEFIDDAELFLENYDEMTLYRLKDISGISFDDGVSIIKKLESEGNLMQFTYNFNFGQVAELLGEASPYDGVSSGEVRVRFIQYGEGNQCGYRVDIASDLNRAWLAGWLSNVEKGSTKVVAA